MVLSTFMFVSLNLFKFNLLTDLSLSDFYLELSLGYAKEKIKHLALVFVFKNCFCFMISAQV